MSTEPEPTTSIPAVAKKLLRKSQMAVIVVAIVFLACWAVTPIRDQLKHLGLFDESSVTAVVALLVTLIVAMINELSERTKRVDDALLDRDRELLERTKNIDAALAMLKPAQSILIVGGINEVYPQLLDELRRVPESERRLDVFGLTLYTAWHQLKGWLAQPQTPGGWEIRLLCVSPELAERKLPWIRDEWFASARSIIGEIDRYVAQPQSPVRLKDVSLTLHQYDCFPALHGFLLGNGTLFISCLRWDASLNQLDDPHFFYEKFESTDRTERAEAYRALFSNWFDHALRTARVPPRPSSSNAAASAVSAPTKP